MGHKVGTVGKVLILAYMFPPFGSVGWSIRTVKFVKYLPTFGWKPVVLTIRNDDYLISRSGALSAAEVPPEATIYRARAVEPPAKGLRKLQDVKQGSAASVLKEFIRAVLRALGKYVLIPDDKILWLPFALPAGWRIVREEAPDVIFATCPPYSMAIIGCLLSHLTGKPFVLDVRDDWVTPMQLAHKPKIVQALERRMEAFVVRRARAVVLVTERSQADFVARYGDQSAFRFHYIPNGCDLAEYEAIPEVEPAETSNDRKFEILHSGSLYESRNPSGLVAALRSLKHSHPEVASRLEIIFRGEVWSDYKRLLLAADLAPLVRIEGFLPRNAFLEASREADLMLVVADQRSSSVIPGKVYECWALGKPILILAEDGAAADFVRANGLGMVAAPDDLVQIKKAILKMMELIQKGQWQTPDRTGLQRFDRRNLAQELANLLNECTMRSHSI